MLSTIAKIVGAFGVVGVLSFLSYLFPLDKFAYFKEFLQDLMFLNGVIPVYDLVNAMFIVVNVSLFYALYKMVIGLIALFTGAGKPEPN